MIFLDYTNNILLFCFLGNEIRSGLKSWEGARKTSLPKFIYQLIYSDVSIGLTQEHKCWLLIVTFNLLLSDYLVNFDSRFFCSFNVVLGMYFKHTLLEIVSRIKKVFKPFGKAFLNSFMKLSLRFWSLYPYLNHLYSGRYGDLLYT